MLKSGRLLRAEQSPSPAFSLRVLLCARRPVVRFNRALFAERDRGTRCQVACLNGRAPLVAGQPEQRRYRARYVDNDVPVGDWSDMVEVTAHP